MKAFFLSLFIILSFSAYSQTEIMWSFVYNSLNDQLEMKAELAEGWHLYSTKLENEGGPVQTEFEFSENKLVILNGDVQEPQPKEEFDPNFEQDVKYFEKEVVFTQKVKFKKKTSIQGSVVYMICNDSMCLPPVEEKFEINLKK